MQITDISSDPSSLALNSRPAAAAVSQNSNLAVSTVSELDPSLQRLSDLPSPLSVGGSEIEDEPGASQTLDLLRGGMLQQPNNALAAHSNDFSQNLLSLLQPAD